VASVGFVTGLQEHIQLLEGRSPAENQPTPHGGAEAVEILISREIADTLGLHVVSPQTASTIEPMLLGLDAGEMDALLLARDQHPDWVLIDERLDSRRIARAMRLPVKGTLEVLLAAVRAGLLLKPEALDGLRQLATSEIRISPR
jgi:predicted nucleic acid-binding protein